MLPASQRTSARFSCPVSSLVSAGPKSGRKMKINFALRPPEKCLLSFELYSRNGDTIKVRDMFLKVVEVGLAVERGSNRSIHYRL